MRRKRTQPDEVQNALQVVEQAIGGPLVPREKDPAAVALGRRGGLKGGRARAANLSPKALSRIGKLGAAARWGKPQKAR